MKCRGMSDTLNPVDAQQGSHRCLRGPSQGDKENGKLEPEVTVSWLNVRSEKVHLYSTWLQRQPENEENPLNSRFSPKVKLKVQDHSFVPQLSLLPHSL